MLACDDSVKIGGGTVKLLAIVVAMLMKVIRIVREAITVIRLMMLATLLLLFITAPASADNGGQIHLTFAADAVDSGFPNPERGFYDQDAPLWVDLERSPQDAETLRAWREQGITMLRWYFVIDEFRSSPISDETLDYVHAQFVLAREAGMKVIPRFTYVWPEAGETWPYQTPDAPVERVLAHIDQIEPILRAHVDVIAFMEIGFVGAWGEWHSSTNILVNQETGINDNSRAIVDTLLAALPPERMVAMRYPPYKQQLYGDAPLTPEEAFSGTPQARMGAHNDCFLASNTDWGTYSEDAAAREALKDYLNLDNRFLPQGGETCNAEADAQPYIGCENALAELAGLRFTTLNIEYEENVLNGWREGGCFAEIADRLGYRFRLTRAMMNESATAGAVFDLSLTLVNDGFATPYNPRNFEIILRSAETGALIRLPLHDQYEPRRWLPDDGEITINAQVMLPSDMPAGRCEVLLAFPDPQPSLYDRPEYAIRLANSGMWEAETGFNALGAVLEVK
jgi:hypothetical protein